MSRPDNWTDDKEGKKRMFSDLKGIKTKQGTSYTSYMKSSRRYDEKKKELAKRMSSTHSWFNGKPPKK